MHYAAYTLRTLESWADWGREYWKVVTSITQSRWSHDTLVNKVI